MTALKSPQWLVRDHCTLLAWGFSWIFTLAIIPLKLSTGVPKNTPVSGFIKALWINTSLFIKEGEVKDKGVEANKFTCLLTFNVVPFIEVTTVSSGIPFPDTNCPTFIFELDAVRVIVWELLTAEEFVAVVPFSKKGALYSWLTRENIKPEEDSSVVKNLLSSSSSPVLKNLMLWLLLVNSLITKRFCVEPSEKVKLLILLTSIKSPSRNPNSTKSRTSPSTTVVVALNKQILSESVSVDSTVSVPVAATSEPICSPAKLRVILVALACVVSEKDPTFNTPCALYIFPS